MNNNRKYSIWGVIGFAMLVLGIVILLIVIMHWSVFGLHSAIPILASGLLKSPFQTTRKMKVDFHQRKGHVERNTEKFFLFIVRSMVVIVALLWLFQKMSQP